jgi:outer membrane protein assembly factor BamD
MEKPDRDYTHAMRAEEEYRALIEQYPDSKLVPQAKQRLREVQEVLAQREFDIGKFYYLRMAYPAAIARLQTLVDRYPLYSGADQALFLVGQSYEAEVDLIRKNGRMNEAAKGRAIEGLTKDAAQAYDKIITRYPAMDRAVDAKDRLVALHQPVPRPTKAMLEQNEKEEASRHEDGMMQNVLLNFERHPDVAKATHSGDPTMINPPPVNPMDIVKNVTNSMTGGNNKLGVQTIPGTVAPNQEAPRSDAPPAADGTVTPPADQAPAAADPAPAGTAAAELKPNVADPNELKPNVEPDATALPPLQQSNQVDSANGTSSTASSSTTAKTEEMADISSSKKKKKKGINKLNPF